MPPITEKDVERLRERERQGRFTVEVIDPPENGELPTKQGQELRVLSIDGNKITLIVSPDTSDAWL